MSKDDCCQFIYYKMKTIKKTIRLLIILMLVVLACLGIGIGVGIPVMSSNRKENINEIKIELVEEVDEKSELVEFEAFL